MPKYKCEIEYLGRKYHGMQRQMDHRLPTIQSKIEYALFKLTGLEIEIGYAGRTDTGVNAKGQVIHFKIENKPNLTPYNIIRGLNHYLINEEIIINKCIKVEDSFDSRFDAKMRTYKYYIINRISPSVVNQNCYHISKKLNILAMKHACMFFIGKYDFSSFRKIGCQGKNPVKTITHLSIAEEGEDMLVITISAQSFLHNMVRIICGTLVDVGVGKINPHDIEFIIRAKNRSLAGKTLPANALFFWSVDY